MGEELCENLPLCKNTIVCEGNMGGKAMFGKALLDIVESLRIEVILSLIHI